MILYSEYKSFLFAATSTSLDWFEQILAHERHLARQPALLSLTCDYFRKFIVIQIYGILLPGVGNPFSYDSQQA